MGAARQLARPGDGVRTNGSSTVEPVFLELRLSTATCRRDSAAYAQVDSLCCSGRRNDVKVVTGGSLSSALGLCYGLHGIPGQGIYPVSNPARLLLRIQRIFLAGQ